jgi:hypothetical protein
MNPNLSSITINAQMEKSNLLDFGPVAPYTPATEKIKALCQVLMQNIGLVSEFDGGGSQ